MPQGNVSGSSVQDNSTSSNSGDGSSDGNGNQDNGQDDMVDALEILRVDRSISKWVIGSIEQDSDEGKMVKDRIIRAWKI